MQAAAGNAADTTMFVDMPGGMKHMRRQFDGWFVLATAAAAGDTADSNCKAVFDHGMRPTTRQKDDTGNRGRPYRRRETGDLDPDRYRRRGTIGPYSGPP